MVTMKIMLIVNSFN